MTGEADTTCTNQLFKYTYQAAQRQMLLRAGHLVITTPGQVATHKEKAGSSKSS